MVKIKIIYLRNFIDSIIQLWFICLNKLINTSTINVWVREWSMFRFMVFNATFNNISAISSVSFIGGGSWSIPEKNHWAVASHWQTLSHNKSMDINTCLQKIHVCFVINNSTIYVPYFIKWKVGSNLHIKFTWPHIVL